MLRNVFFLFTVALCLPAPPSAAQDGPEYLVEVIVFRHVDPFDAGEVWTPAVPPFPPPPVVEDPDVEPPPPRRIGRFERLSADEFRLADAARKIADASRLSILGHTGWRQGATSLEESLAKSIAGRDDLASVSGSVLLYRSRHLRLDFDLTLTTRDGTYPLRQERRRVQTGVPHYIDHPHFGVLVMLSRAPTGEDQAEPAAP